MAEEIGYVEDVTPITNVLVVFGVVSSILLTLILIIIYGRR